MFRRLSYALSWIVLICCSERNMLAQDETVQDETVQAGTQEERASQQKLVRLLGDSSFFTRERATKELASLGMAARAVLTEATADPDLEIRIRALRILERVNSDAFESRLAAFVADVDDRHQLSLPGWTQFRDLVGAHREAREMFAEMTRCESGLLHAFEKQVAELPELYASRIALVQSQTASANSVPQTVLKPTVATLLLIGCDKRSKKDSTSVRLLYQLLCHPVAMHSIGIQAHKSVLRSLLEECATFTSSVYPTYGMTLALKYNLKEYGLQQAIKILKTGTTSSSSLQSAVITLGRFGGKEHVALLKPLLDNKTVCNRWGNPQLKKNGTINVEVRDTALVMLLRLSEQAPENHGFKLLQENPETVYYAHTFGFVHEEEREEAHAKWAAESKENENSP